MPVFRVNIDRRVVRHDRFTRFIEAETASEAEALAAKLAADANEVCPDDARDSGHDSECEDFQVNDSEPSSEGEASAEDCDVVTAETLDDYTWRSIMGLSNA